MDKFKTDAEWYCREDPEADRYYEILFENCRKFGVDLSKKNEKDKAFIEEVTRVSYERERAERLGIPANDIRPFFGEIAV